MSLFNELKHRNVFKVGFAYTVVGWLLIQVAEVVAPQMNLPEWTPRMITFVVLLGFPVSLVMAWALELTPEGVKKASGSNAPIYIFGAILVAISFYWYFDTSVTTTIETTRPVTLESPPSDQPGSTEPPSVAVLPFVNMSSDAENEYFSDGITEELLNLLVRVDGLRVPSRTSSFAFKGLNTDIRDIAQQLEVNHILEGSVRKSGNQVRITAQLIDVGTDTHLWSDTYDRELEDIFVIQDEIASRIVRELELTLTDSREENKPTDNLEAYNLYLQGLFQFRQRYDSVRDAEITLRQAVELDPEFAEAWAILGLNYTVQPNYLFTPLEEIEGPALEAANRAEALDPSMVAPDLIRGNIASKKSELLQAVEYYESSIRKQPKDALSRLWLGIALLEGGFVKEAKEHLDVSRALDPAAGITADWQSRAYVMTGDPDTGVRLANEGLALGRPASIISLMHNVLANGEELDDELLDLASLPMYQESWKRVARVLHDPEQWPGTIEWVRNIKSGTTADKEWAKLNTYQFLAEPQVALDLIAETVSQDATILTTLWFPIMKRLRTSPEFKQFAAESGLLEMWQSRGWPDLCRPLGEDDFECD